MNGQKEQDIWYILKSIGGLATPIMLAIIGGIGSYMIYNLQERSNQSHLYTELISQKENAESQLRKDMFEKVLSSFFLGIDPKKGCLIEEINEKIFRLELLSRNFHEMLDMEPLFTYVLYRIIRFPELEKPPQPINKESKSNDCSHELYRQYNLWYNKRSRVILTDTVDDLNIVNEAPNSVIVARVGTHLYIRIFDADGKRVVDKTEEQLMSGETLTALKKQLNSFHNESDLSLEQKQKIIQDAISIIGYTQLWDNTLWDNTLWDMFKKDFMNRKLDELRDIAKRITKKQMESLINVETRLRIPIDLSQTCNNITPRESPSFPAQDCEKTGVEVKESLVLQDTEIQREFTVTVKNSYPKWNQIKVKVRVKKTEEEKRAEKIAGHPLDKHSDYYESEFWLSYFDFPLTDNTFISENERYSVILDSIDRDKKRAEISLLYFPAVSAGLKEKSFYQQKLASELMKSNKLINY